MKTSCNIFNLLINVYSKIQQVWTCLWNETIDNKDNEHIHTCWLSCTPQEFWSFPLPPLHSDPSDVLSISIDKSAFYRMLVQLSFSSFKELQTYRRVRRGDPHGLSSWSLSWLSFPQRLTLCWPALPLWLTSNFVGNMIPVNCYYFKCDSLQTRTFMSCECKWPRLGN